jgi:hypothetical protein
MKKHFVVLGFMGSCPIAGVVWQHIHYIVGLQRLGHEVTYVEDTARYPYDPIKYEVTADYGHTTSVLSQLAAQFNFRWCYVPSHLPDHDPVGLGRKELLQLYCDADAMFNICGSHVLNEDQLQNRCLIYIESDPGVEQIKVDKGETDTIEYLKKHHALFTFGENIGTSGFPVPTHYFNWQSTRQPIVTDLWKAEPPPSGAVFTSIANWSTAGQKDIEWRGEKYLWSKSLEFLKFIEASKRAGETFELATTIRDQEISERFRANGWRLVSPDQLSTDYEHYKRYIQNSKGEFTAAKDQYVRLNTGWFSDRSACYLAAGRPVITQETGFSDYYGEGWGLLPFRTLDEIVDAARKINADYERHSRAAYEIAREFFEAETVLASLLQRAGF